MNQQMMKLYGLLVILDHAANNSPEMQVGDFCPSISQVKNEFEATQFTDLPAHDCMSEDKLTNVVQIQMTDDNGRVTGVKSLAMCTVCGRRHWSMDVMPIIANIEGSSIG